MNIITKEKSRSIINKINDRMPFWHSSYISFKYQYIGFINRILNYKTIDEFNNSMDFVILPGKYSPIFAKILEEEGFELYIKNFSVDSKLSKCNCYSIKKMYT